MSKQKSRIEELEKRVQHLEDQIEMMLELVDDDKYPFMYLALESGLTKSQINQIFDLMEEVSRATSTDKKPMSHSEFENRIYQIVPTHKGDYHLAESIVRSLNSKGQYTEVYQHMKKSGMNLKSRFSNRTKASDRAKAKSKRRLAYSVES
jgi:hypothetical protein